MKTSQWVWALAAVAACADGADDVGTVERAVVVQEVTMEVCNGLDDDGDLVIDEGVGPGEACTSGLGACAQHGTTQCAPDGATQCALPSYPMCSSIGWPSTVAANPWTEDVALADVTGDGIVDILLVDHGPDTNQLTVRRGLGDATFAAVDRYPLSIGYGRGLAVGHFNSDGRLDVAVANLYGIELFRNDGTGGFITEGFVNTGTSPIYVTVADLNADGRADLVAPGQSGNSVGIVLGTGDFTFGSAQLFDSGTGPWDAAVADYNRDGKLDLAINNANGQSISVLMGNGDGSFKQRTQYAVEPGGGPYDVQTGDLDRDGKLDLVTTGIDGTAVLRGTGNGTFAAPVYLNDGAAFRVALSDTSGDGLLDLVSINGSTSVSYFTNLGGLTFSPANTVPYGSGPTAIAMADLDNNTSDDIVIVMRGDEQVAILKVGACAPAPQSELCNSVDDDCDGVTDEGVVCDVGGCAPGELDMLDWMTLDEDLRGNTRLVSPGHPLYTVVEDDRFWWLKSAQGDTWDVNAYDADYIYFAATEQSFHTPWACKPAVDLQQWRAARRCVGIGAASATIVNTDSVFQLVSSAEVQLTSGHQGTRFEVRDAGSMNWGAGIGVQPTIVLDYHWNCSAGTCAKLEQYFLTKRYGLMRWSFFDHGVLALETTFVLDAQPATPPAPMFACDLPPDYAQASPAVIGWSSAASERPSVAMANGTTTVAFDSAATNLVGGDTNGVADVFIRRNGVTLKLTNGNGASRAPVLSRNGRFVAFESDASNLVTKDANKATDVFVYDLETNQLILISGVSGDAAKGRSSAPSISADGCKVAFVSSATNLVSGDMNKVDDVFVRDHCAGTTRRVSVTSTGKESNQPSSQPSIDDLGRFVAYVSTANNLRPTAPPVSTANVFIWDGVWGVTTGHIYGNAGSSSPRFSGGTDSQFIVFASNASNLVAGDTVNSADLFVYNRFTNTIASSPTRLAGLAGATAPQISADGRFLAFVAARAGGGTTAYLYDRSPENAALGVPGQVTSPRALDGSVTTAEPTGVALTTTTRTVAGLTVTDGFTLAWSSTATNIVPGTDTVAADVFTRTVVVP